MTTKPGNAADSHDCARIEEDLAWSKARADAAEGRLREAVGHLSAVCRSALLLPRPWVDGGITANEWIASGDAIKAARAFFLNHYPPCKPEDRCTHIECVSPTPPQPASICDECGSALDAEGHIANYPCSKRTPPPSGTPEQGRAEADAVEASGWDDPAPTGAGVETGPHSEPVPGGKYVCGCTTCDPPDPPAAPPVDAFGGKAQIPEPALSYILAALEADATKEQRRAAYYYLRDGDALPIHQTASAESEPVECGDEVSAAKPSLRCTRPRGHKCWHGIDDEGVEWQPAPPTSTPKAPEGDGQGGKP